MAKWSKALVLGTSHFGSMGSNPTPVICFVCFSLHCGAFFHSLLYEEYIIIKKSYFLLFSLETAGFLCIVFSVHN